VLRRDEMGDRVVNIFENKSGTRRCETPVIPALGRLR
jgi:hypothetical protein